MNKCFLVPDDKKSLEKWDSFVFQHPDGWLTQHSTWSDILLKCFGNIYPFRLAVVNSSDYEIKAALSLFLIKSSFAVKRLIGAPLATFFDPLVTSSDDFYILLNRALDLKKDTNSSSIKIKTFKSRHHFQQSNFSAINSFITHILTLEDDLQTIWKRLDRTCIRKNIKRVGQHDINFTIISENNNLKKFFLLYSDTRKRHGLPSIPLRFFQAIFDIYVPNKNAYFLLLEYKGIPIASLLVFIYKNRCSAEALGWDINYKWLSPSILIYWEAIKLAYNTGCRFFDFGRTSITNKSLISFKRRWGTEEVEIPIYSYPAGKARKGLLKEHKMVDTFPHLIFRWSPYPIYAGLSDLYYRWFCES